MGAPPPFASGEHLWLGDHAATAAASRLIADGYELRPDAFERISRRTPGTTFTYGELVALSGDFYGSPEELFEEEPVRLPFPGHANDLRALRAAFARELDWIEKRQRGLGRRAYPQQELAMVWGAKSYLELALRNVDHFGWHNMVAYCRHHAAALELARRARGKEGETWQRALVTNAFADHFLTDAFAAGHIRVPRAQLRAWAKRKDWPDSLAGALSKLLHDQDGHIDTRHGLDESDREDEGLPVIAGGGMRWRARCDGQLFLRPKHAQSQGVRLAVHAVVDSLGELVAAWKEGARPPGLFGATRFVPVPDPAAPALTEKFSPGSAAAIALYESAGWYMKIPWLGPGLKRAHVEALLADLPDLMGRFRAQVRRMLEADPVLRERLFPGYVDGFLRIR